MDLLTIKVTAIRDAYNVAARRRVSDATTICDRCQDAREPVVAKLEIVTVEKAWTLCARCLKEMPQGLHLA
jgi:excisionase family DNA binding protein